MKTYYPKCVINFLQVENSGDIWTHRRTLSQRRNASLTKLEVSLARTSAFAFNACAPVKSIFSQERKDWPIFVHITVFLQVYFTESAIEYALKVQIVYFYYY